jgi:hypothetical protein
MSLPETMMANPLPITTNPAARPRMELSNHEVMSPMTGTFAAPLPTPVII